MRLNNHLSLLHYLFLKYDILVLPLKLQLYDLGLLISLLHLGQIIAVSQEPSSGVGKCVGTLTTLHPGLSQSASQEFL
jgi:hypothetical protein